MASAPPSKRPRVSLRDLRHGAEIIAILGAGIWAFYTFIYVERIKPLAQPPTLNVTVTADTNQSSSGFDFATIHLKYTNLGAWDMDVVAESINVFGEGVGAGRTSHADSSAEYLREPSQRLQDARLIQAWAVQLRGSERAGATADQILLLPGQTFDEQRTVVVRHRAFPALRVQYFVVFSKAPIVTPISVSVTPEPDGAVTLTAAAPSDSGAFVVPLP